MRVWSIISTVFLLLVILCVVIFFAVEKNIPADWVGNSVKNAVQNIGVHSFEEINELGNFGMIKDEKVYTVEDGVRTLSSHTITESVVVGKDTELKSHYKKQVVNGEDDALEVLSEDERYYFIENGMYKSIQNGADEEMLVSSWRKAILMNLQSVMPINKEGDFAYLDILENNVERVTQKGVYVMIYASKDNIRLKFGYDFMNGQLKEYTEEIDTLDGDKVVSTTVNSYQILYQSSIEIPTE